MGHVGNSEKIQVESTGEGWGDFLDDMDAGKNLYALARFKIDGMYKYVFISWCGEGVQGQMKGRFGQFSRDMEKFLKVFP